LCQIYLWIGSIPIWCLSWANMLGQVVPPLVRLLWRSGLLWLTVLPLPGGCLSPVSTVLSWWRWVELG
jgi:hypothetical protein